MINCNVCALAQNNFQINKIQQKHHDSISIDINHLNNTSNISEEETKQDAETPNGPGLLRQKQDLEHQIKTLWNQVKEESAISTSTSASIPVYSTLELQQTLNEKIIQLQSMNEVRRVNKIFLHLKNKTDKTATKNDSDSKVCRLCSQPFSKPTRYDEHFCEYFTCCGKPICKSCHVTYVSSHDYHHDNNAFYIDDAFHEHELKNLLSNESYERKEEKKDELDHDNTNLITIKKMKVSTSPLSQQQNYEELLKNHQCPFCKEPWSKDEFEDSQRILKLAEKGISWAQVEIARRYEHGMGVEPCEELASKWFHVAAEQGDPCGQYNVGRFHKWGIGNSSCSCTFSFDSSTSSALESESQLENGLQLAKQYFEKAAKSGHAKAQHDLATMLVDSCETAQDDCLCDDALHWFTLSLLQGCDEALYSIGNLYLTKGKMKKDKLERAYNFGRALYWLRQSAEKGLARGQMLFGMALLENAKNVFGDNLFHYTCSGFNVVPQVFHWLRKSASNGELDAGTRLKNCQNLHLKQCAFCHKTGDLQWRKCQRCYGVSYCSKICQDKDWKNGHKHDCYKDPLMPNEGTELLLEIK